MDTTQPTTNRNTWRAVAAALPLPMLALSAAYGVYSFQALFVPAAFALISAAAFELTYIGLAVMPVADAARRRATVISVSAVIVSVLYNSLAGLFHVRPALLADRVLWADVTLAVLHGLPLAVVAYAVADLLLHQRISDTEPAPALALARQEHYPVPIEVHAPDAVLPVAMGRNASTRECPHCGAELSMARYAAAVRYGHCSACKRGGDV